jgi:tRNA (uracil-5-)-methyltransferase TRM9
VIQKLFEAVSPRHGRILIYVWAIEQDELSKRVIPALGQARKTCADADQEQHPIGQDVFVPWVLSSDNTSPKVPRMVHAQNVPETTPVAIRRYYHMFAKDELRALVENAARELGLKVCPASSNEAESNGTGGVEIVASGWERSNYYIELRRWQKIRQ